MSPPTNTCMHLYVMEEIECKSVYAYLQFQEYPSENRYQKRILRNIFVSRMDYSTTLFLVLVKQQRHVKRVCVCVFLTNQTLNTSVIFFCDRCSIY